MGYVSSTQFKPAEEHNLRVNIKIPGEKELKASSIIPPPVPIISVDTSSAIIHYQNFRDHFYKCLVLSVKFKDPQEVTIL